MILLKNGYIYDGKVIAKKDVLIKDKLIVKIADEINENCKNIDCTNKLISPSFIDPHVHLREPGLSYKETILDGTKAAARGGYTCIFSMPNVKPVPSNVNDIKIQQDIIDRDACIEVKIIGSITENQLGTGNLTSIEKTNDLVIGYSDDGRGIKNSLDMYNIMVEAKKHNKSIISHCEDIDLVLGGVVTECDFAKKNNLKEIMPESETVELARNLVLANKTKVHLHVCHISSKESVDLVRFYKTKGCNVTAEVCPHHLILNDQDLKLNGNYKMNPPIMTKDNQEALVKGLLDGTIDCLATDHAPHAVEEKNKGFDSAFGIVGIEYSFALMYTNFVLKDLLTLPQLIDLLNIKVANVFKIKSNEIKENE